MCMTTVLTVYAWSLPWAGKEFLSSAKFMDMVILPRINQTRCEEPSFLLLFALKLLLGTVFPFPSLHFLKLRSHNKTVGDTLGSNKGKYYGGRTLTGHKALPVLEIHGRTPALVRHIEHEKSCNRRTCCTDCIL